MSWLKSVALYSGLPVRREKGTKLSGAQLVGGLMEACNNPNNEIYFEPKYSPLLFKTTK